MAQMQKPNPKNMVKVGDLRKIVGNLRTRQSELNNLLQGVQEVDDTNRNEFIERNANEDKIMRYQKILDKFDKKKTPREIISKVIRERFSKVF